MVAAEKVSYGYRLAGAQAAFELGVYQVGIERVIEQLRLQAYKFARTAGAQRFERLLVLAALLFKLCGLGYRRQQGNEGQIPG